MVRSEKMARAYLQGCFLASGSINSPKSSNYHLEMSSQEKDLALSVQKLMQRFYLPAKVIERKSVYVVYIKAGDKIADFLRMRCLNLRILEFKEISIIRSRASIIVRLPMR